MVGLHDGSWSSNSIASIFNSVKGNQLPSRMNNQSYSKRHWTDWGLTIAHSHANRPNDASQKSKEMHQESTGWNALLWNTYNKKLDDIIDYDWVRRWAKKSDTLSKRALIFPINRQENWQLMIIKHQKTKQTKKKHESNRQYQHQEYVAQIDTSASQTLTQWPPPIERKSEIYAWSWVGQSDTVWNTRDVREYSCGVLQQIQKRNWKVQKRFSTNWYENTLPNTFREHGIGSECII